MLFSMEEIQDVLSLLNRASMSRIEQRFAREFFERLVVSCQPTSEPKVEEELINGE